MAGPLSMEQIKVVSVVTFYMAAAILMVMVNKWVLMSSDIPVFFVFCQLLIAVVLLVACKNFGMLSLPRWDTKVVKSLWATVLVNVLGFTFNSLCIQYVDATFYQVARGLVLPITVALAFATNAAPPSYNCVLCCVIITFGFLIGIIWDSSVSLPTASLHGASGVVFGVLSSFTTALNAIIVRKNLAAVNGSAIALAWYSNLLTSWALLPFSLVKGEGHAVMEMLSDPQQLRTFTWGVCLTGFVGFLISVAGLLSVKLTSPVTHIVSSALRSVLQTAISVEIFGDVLSTARLSSISCIMLGSCAYVWVKHIEQAASGLPSTTAAALQKEKAESVAHSPLRPLTAPKMG